MAMSVEELLAQARASIDRVTVDEMMRDHAGGALVVDTRPLEQRERDGALPFAVIIDRNVLEWRLAPSSDARIPEAATTDRVIVVCNEGFSSSLAAATLRQLGVARATDLVGGFQAWLAAGSPTPD